MLRFHSGWKSSSWSSTVLQRCDQGSRSDHENTRTLGPHHTIHGARSRPQSGRARRGSPPSQEAPGVGAVRPEMPSRNRDAASATRITRATVRACRSSQPRATARTGIVRSGAMSSITSARPRGSSDTTKTVPSRGRTAAWSGHWRSTSFSAMTMNTPALSTAPAPRIVIAGAEATWPPYARYSSPWPPGRPVVERFVPRRRAAAGHR